MNDLTFLDEELAGDYGASDAILKVVLPGGEVIHVSDAVSPFKFLDVCPLLYHAFEYNSQSRLQASIDASSETAVISLARYCYTGSYLAAEPDGEHILLLQHAETYKIAEDFDLPALQIMAHGNFSCQIEYACCLPDPPEDLLDTIRFVYRHFASDEARRKHNLVDTLLNYCVAVYLSHKLGYNQSFLTAIHEISAFRQDLCRTNLARNFEDDCAADIIRLPSGPATSSNVPTLLASRELPSEMLYDLPAAPVPTGRSRLNHANYQEKMNRITLSYRRGVLGVQSFRQGIPDRSKHCVSPSALTAALEKHNATTSDADSDGNDSAKDTLRKYKRARIEEATARLEGWPLVSENDTTEQKPAPTKADEDAYWAGVFGQPDTKPQPERHSTLPAPSDDKGYSLRLPPPTNSSLPAADTTPPTTLPPLIKHEPDTLNSPHLSPSSNHPPIIKHEHPTTTLPHRPHDPPHPATADSSIEDTDNDDDDFAIVHHPLSAANSRMSSPELVDCAGEMEAAGERKRGSEEGWTLV